MVPQCPTCTYYFEREEGFFLGAFVMSTAITLAALMAFLVIGFATTLPDPPLVKLAIIGAVVGFGVPVLVYPFTKTLWTAVYMIMSRTMGDPWKRLATRRHPPPVRRSTRPPKSLQTHFSRRLTR